MTILSVKAGADPAVFRIGLSDGSLFSCKTAYLPPAYQGDFFAAPSRELSSQEEETLRFAAACYRTERAALRLIARAEQCRFGLERKLIDRGCEEPCVRAVLDYLSALEVVNDERFAVRWLQSRSRSGAGTPKSLLAALCRRGIRGGTAQKVLSATLDVETETAMAKRYLRKKGFGTQEKNLRSVLRREGFSQELIRSLLLSP